jgi:hypothetical protein
LVDHPDLRQCDFPPRLQVLRGHDGEREKLNHLTGGQLWANAGEDSNQMPITALMLLPLGHASTTPLGHASTTWMKDFSGWPQIPQTPVGMPSVNTSSILLQWCP